MQLDMFGGPIDESAAREAVPPVLSPGGGWSSPEALAFNAALKRGALRDAVSILNSLRVNLAAQVLLASGFTIGPTDNRANLIAFVQKDILAAVQQRMTGHELRVAREATVTVEMASVDSASEINRSPITQEIAGSLRPGALVIDGAGQKYLAFSARFSYLEVHPLNADGKPEIFAGNSIFFHLDAATADAYPGRRHDPVYLDINQDIANSLGNEHNKKIQNAVIASSKTEVGHDGRIGDSEGIRDRSGEQDRGDGRNGGIDRESLENGVARSGEAFVGGGDVSGASGEPGGEGVGSIGERGGPSASGTARDIGHVRNSGGTAGNVKAAGSEFKRQKYTREELSKLYVTDMTDEQLLQAKDIYLEGGRAKAIARQLTKRGIEPVLDAGAVPAWYTHIPEAGLPMVASELGPVGYREVGPRIAKEAVDAITQVQKLGGGALYAYVLAAKADVNGRVRFVPEDQPAPQGWALLNNAAYRPGMLSNEQMIARLSQELSNSPVLGVVQEVKTNSLEKVIDAGNDFVPQDGWRTSLMGARAYARHLGIDIKDRSVYSLVDKIDETLADTIENINTDRMKRNLADRDYVDAMMSGIGDNIEAATGTRPVWISDQALPAKANRQAWEISAVDFIRGSEANPFFDKSYPFGSGDAPYLKEAQEYHKKVVLDALAQGEAVPSDVLDSYPELSMSDQRALGEAGGKGNDNSPARSVGFDGVGEMQGKVKVDDVAVAMASAADYVLTDADRIGLGGLAEKFQDNLQAIRVLKALEAEKRHAVGVELRELARYVGWGGLKGVFDPDNKQWGKQHMALRSLLSDAEWAAASRSQLNAFYTPPVVAKAMFAGVARLGFERGRVLEPSVGVGNFFGLMPESMRQNSALHGVELDVLTSQIVAALYPSAKIAKATGFQAYNVPAGYFDMAVGNPPFGSEAVTDDKGSAYSGWSIHNYFFAKSIDMLRPGGIMPMVVSHSFLDKLDPHVRQWIARRAELISGARLPNTAFKGSANTEVVTDVLIFRRLDNENELGKQELPDWLNTTDVMIENPKTGESEAIAINNYFINNPQNVLGTNSATSSQFRANEYTVLPTGNLEEQLAHWVESLPVGIYVPLERTVVELETAAVAVPEFVKEGSFFVLEGGKDPAQGGGLDGSSEAAGNGRSAVEVWQRLPDQLGERQAVKWEPANQRAFERMVGMIGIREALRSQMRLERSMDAGDAEIEVGRRLLNRVYDGFQSKFGFVNDQINRRLFLDDTESALIQALEFDYEKSITPTKAEEYGIDPRPARAVKADIFSRRVLFPPVEVEVVETAKDALLHSLNLKGAVDLDYMQHAYGKDKEAIISELGDLLFLDPVLGMVTAEEYLSGDVKTKLAEAVKAAERDLSLTRNVEALKAVLPADKMPSEIHAAMGASWIPAEMFSAFAKEVSGADATYTYLKGTGQWLSRATSQPDYVKNETEFGTNKMTALEILAQTMNSRGLEVKKPVSVGESIRYVTDEEATEAVRQRSDKMRGHWDSWLWADGGRADKLMSIYNDRFNRTVERSYDGSHLTFPGMNPAITLLAHQKNGVWRGLQDRVMLLDQVVGAGKTFEVAAMAMEMRRLGITKKPLIAVPNHLTLQWRSEFYRLYPGANVLAATPQDFDKENRERFFSKIVTGNWDAVIVGHSSLKKIAVPMEMEVKIIKEQFDDMAAAIEDMKRDRGDRNVIRDMEKIKSNLEAKMTKLKESGGKKDNVVDFADLGVDAIIVDEMHEFKNLTFTTQMNRVSGLGNPTGSGKAFDLFVKIRWLQETFGDKVPLITATGTPISNSLAEMFTMQRYMQYGKLKANGLNVFDAWAKQYGDVQNVYEVAPSGTGYRLSQRFAKFKNLPSLMGEYRSFADVITLDDLKAQELALGKVFPVPKLVGGRPLNVVAERSELQEKFFGIPEIVRGEDGEIKFEIDLKFPVTINQRDDGKYVAMQDFGGYAQTSKAYDTKEEAEYMTALGATTPKMKVDPKSIVGQFENLRELTRSTKGKINALSLTGLANKAGLDYRLINPGAIDFSGSKVNIAVGNMLALAKQWDADKGVQLVFCDQSVPLSAKAKMASKEKRIYVREDDERLTHKKGTLHTLKEYEGLPYFLVAVGKGDGKTFSMYDPVCGRLMKDGLDSKQEAHAFVAAFIAKEGGQERWLDQRELSRPIGVDEIDEYKNEHAIDADGEAADLEISMQDIEGATGVSGFSIYDDVKAKLVAGGIHAHQIEFIHDHDTPQAKDLLFKRVNAGDVRFLLGSTPKMGAGTNVQKRLVGLHHIDAPWRPSDLEQREGRIIRRGNMFYERDPVGFVVAVNRYATAQTYDTRRWQLLEHKAAGLEQLRNYDGANEIDDVVNEASNSADMKAAASGNPLILKETQLTNEVKKLRMLERAHRDGEYSIRSRFNHYKRHAEKAGPKELDELRGLLVKRDGAQVLGELDGKNLLDKEMVVTALGRVAKIIEKTEEPKEILYRGVTFEFKLNGFLNTPISITTPDGYRYDMDKLSPTGVVTRMDNWCEGLEGKISGCERKISEASEEAGKIAGQLGKPFEQADKLLASIAEHGKVQRALMKSNSMAAVKPEEMMAFQAAVNGQKATLRGMGLGRAVDEIEREGAEVDSAENGQGEGQGSAHSAGLDGLDEVQGKGIVVGDGTDLGDMEQFIKVAANSIGDLRKVDVFRVLVESNRAMHREAIADYIKGARPDLAEEVDDVMEEERAEVVGVVPLTSLSGQAAVPATIFGLSGARIEAMQGGKLRGAEQFPGLAPVALSAEQMASRASALLAVREGEQAAVDAAAGQDVRLMALLDAGIQGTQILQAAKELADGDDGLIVDLARIAGVVLPAAPLLQRAGGLSLVDHIKTRMVDALSVEVPAGAIVMNAPRPLLGSLTMEGDFVSGRFYAAILPDDPMATKFIEENRKLDARVLAVVSRDARMELAMHKSGRRDDYLKAAPDPEVRFEWLAGGMAKFQDLPYGELSKAIGEAMGAVKEGVYSGPITAVADGLATQKYNREGDIVRHSLGWLSDKVAVGDIVDIKYQGGIGLVGGLAVEANIGR
ncbi:hypothetical protein [Janthinobacterium sp. CAN_S7]|uniref:Eco57I restriction-modification methylase domain-containing protein n=1 Tax=Janthinobacterium sp. CAN_S7 TaxID=3071704 RepID=UPI00319E4672